MAPRAVLGGDWQPPLTEEQVKQLKQTVQDSIAPGKSRSWSLTAAMVDPNLDVYAYQRLEDAKYVEHFSEQEAAQQDDPDAWQKGEAITTPGAPLSVTGTVATELWLANHEAEDFTGFKRLYGLENDPALLEPSWADFLIDAMASPAVAMLLLVIGFAALYVELQAPGIGIGGFCAAVCFILFFWSRFLGGTAGALEVILFLGGICFLLVEVFVLPGFGIFGPGRRSDDPGVDCAGQPDFHPAELDRTTRTTEGVVVCFDGSGNRQYRFDRVYPTMAAYAVPRWRGS